jgi:hypothetical protein
LEVTALVEGGSGGDGVAGWFEGRRADIWVRVKSSSRRALEKKCLS